MIRNEAPACSCRGLSLTAALFAGLFTACDDSGANATSGIASYDTLPKFCEEGDTIKLANKSELFYCKNGDWLEVGLIIPTGTSSNATKPTNSSSTQISSSGSSLDTYFSFLSDHLTWDKNSDYPILKNSVSIADFEQVLQEHSFSIIDLSSLMESQVKYLAGKIGASDNFGNYVSFFVSKVQKVTLTSLNLESTKATSKS